jgi:tripartite-type tricarboxylate transporter receptor subunit TctC
VLNLRIVLLALAAISCAAGANAQPVDNYPSRPVKMIVPFPAGGPTDVLARAVAQRLTEVWGQPVVIENLPGANTAIAAARVARMPADGYTLLAAMDVTMVLNPITNKSLSYEPLKDFSFITLGAKNTSLLTVRAADGPKTVAELIVRAKASPGKLNYGAGIITTRLAGYLLTVRPASTFNTSRSPAARRPYRACSPAPSTTSSMASPPTSR